MCLGSFVLFLCTLWVLCALFFSHLYKVFFTDQKKKSPHAWFGKFSQTVETFGMLKASLTTLSSIKIYSTGNVCG